jgi:UDP-galactopyranose mutase
MKEKDREFDIIVVGAGLSGGVIAERYANVLNQKVLILEKRNHIGGNCYDFVDEAGILLPLYGGHIFHTNDEEVWEYINHFAEWRPYKHRVKSFVDGKFVPIPVNIETINAIFDLNLTTEEEAKTWLDKNTEKIKDPKNGEEAALARVGRVLYEKMFKNYNYKHWGLWPTQLDASVLSRIPVRTNFEDGYFSDKYQVMPKESYVKFFEKLLSHPKIEIRLNEDFFAIKDSLPPHKKLFFTGRIDQYFDRLGYEPLQYRSLRFEYKTINQEYFLECGTVNFPNDNDFTRIMEPKHMTGQKHPKTTIVKDYSTDQGEPFYPIPNSRNQEIYAQYQKEAEQLESQGIYFVGRLANYKYIDMDQAVRNVLDLFMRLEMQKS